MQPITNQEEIKEQIKVHDLVVIYFTGSACGACEVIKEKVESILAKYPKVKGVEVNGEKYPEVAIGFEVYALPLMILFVQGRESLRVGRNLDLREFEAKLIRYMKMM